MPPSDVSLATSRPPACSAGEGAVWPLPLRRRRVAVLAADLAGYARLMEAREEETYARMLRVTRGIVEPGIADHHGRIVKHTGDGFIAIFDDPRDAAACALALQDAMARVTSLDAPAPPLLFRIGLNLADAIVESDDIFGEGVVLASRLQQSAEPGGVLASAGLAEAVRGVDGVSLADVGELPLKHLTRPVRAMVLRRAGAAPSPPPALLPPLPDDRPSIAVLPFRRYRGGDEAAWFAEGVIDGIVHVLSGIEGLFVISPGSTFAFAAGAPPDARAVGRELGVRYVLFGTLDRDGSRLRIATELAEATTGAVLRADRHDGAVEALFQMQDRLAAQVVAAVAPAVRQRELARALRKPPGSLSAYELVLQALNLLYRLDRACFDRARGLLQQAMALDPGYAPAWAHAATWHMFRIGQGWSTPDAGDAAEAARLAGTAIASDPENAVALAIKGHMLAFTGRDYDAALETLDRAIAAGPSCFLAWTLGSATCGWVGDAGRAALRAERALQLSPLDPFAFFGEHMLSQAHYVAGDWRRAIAWGRRAATRNGSLTSNLRTLAASLVAAGEVEEARRVAARMLAVQPGFRLSAFAARTPFVPAILDVHIPRLRAAGLPD